MGASPAGHGSVRPQGRETVPDMTAAVGALNFVSFDAETHTYRLGDRRLLSVTQALSAAALIDAEWYTEESRIRGRFVHRAIMYEEREGLDDSSIDERLAGYVAAYRAFIRDVRPGPCLLLEMPLADPFLGFAGTPDQF